jgi:hypothetical protein
VYFFVCYSLINIFAHFVGFLLYTLCPVLSHLLSGPDCIFVVCDIRFHVMLKDVMLGSTTTVKTYSETQTTDGSSGAGGMETLEWF